MAKPADYCQAIHSALTSTAALKHSSQRLPQPSFARPARRALAAGNPGIDQVAMQHGIVLGHDLTSASFRISTASVL